MKFTNVSNYKRVNVYRNITTMNLKFIIFFCFALFLTTSIAQFEHHQSFGWDPVFNNALISVDTDGDGDIDFIASSTFSGPRLIENIGDNLFERPVYLTDEEPSYTEQKLIDLEGDGNPDFIGMRGEVGQIVAFKNIGDNEFTKTPIYDPGGVLLFDLKVTDMDGDGDQDITFRASSSAIYWLENDGTGDFSLNTIYTDGFSLDNYANFDGDGDGDIDLCIHAFGSNALSYVENLGGTFATPILLTDEAMSLATIISFDYDEDGDNDLFYSYGSDVKLLENLGEATFSTPTTFAALAGGFQFPFTDIDGDGLLDFVSHGVGTSLISWKRNLGAGIYEAVESIMQIAGPGLVAEFKDFDLDGKEDLLFLAYGGSAILYYQNLDDGDFAEAFYLSETTVHPNWVHAFDADNDGDQDLFCVSQWDRRISWVENLGEGNFSEIKTAFALHDLKPVHVNSSDIDGDGLEDLLGVSYTDRSFWVKNMGDGTFANLEIIADEPCSPAGIIGDDWDGDGDNDIIVNVATGYFMKIYENIDGIISPTGVTFASDYANIPISSEDLDGDGDPDILYASNSDYTMKWLENTGDLSFVPHDIGDEIVNILQSSASDMDGDGDLDVIFVSTTDNTAAWIENLGDGLFGGTEVLTTECLYPVTINHEDINDDGIGDLVIGSLIDDVISWFPGMAEDDALFGTRTILFDSIIDISSLLIEDLDLDGDNDLVYVASPEWVWSWIENLHIIYESGIDDFSTLQLTVYPNPFSDVTTITFADELTEDHTIIIYDILGTEVYRRANITGQQIKINKADIGAGLYFLAVFDGSNEQVFTAKLIAE